MRLTTVILIASLMQVSAATFGQRITLSQKNVPLKTVLRELTRQSGYDFVYNGKAVGADQKVTVSLSNAEFDEALKSVLTGLNLSYKLDGKIVSIRKAEEPSIFDRITARFQVVDLSGFVTDQDGRPLIGATVIVKGTRLGAATDQQGRFFIANAPDNGTLLISSIGRESREVLYRGGQTPSIILRAIDNNLNEIVIAYGKVQEKYSTSNVGTVKGEDISRQPVSNPLIALQGRVPGLLIQQQNGLNTGLVSVTVQGKNSLNSSNDPFYVIDGVPLVSTSIATIGNVVAGSISGSGRISNLNFINPNEIESITILKDADATAIYGSRAANGAILITTKKGKAGKTKVDLNLQTGWGQVADRLKVLNTDQYIALKKEIYTNGNEPITPAAIDVNGVWSPNRNMNWQKELSGEAAKFQNLRASISGGSENTQFLAGAGYIRETPVFKGDFSNVRTSVNFNINHSSTDKKFRFFLSSSYLEGNNQLPVDDITELAYTMAPNAPDLYNADGTINWAPVPDVYPFQSINPNPAAILQTRYTNKTSNLVANSSLSYELIPGFNIKSTFGYNSLQNDESGLNPTASLLPELRSFGMKPFAIFSDKSIKTWIIEPQITFTRSFSFGTIDALLGSTFQNTESSGLTLRGADYNNDVQLADFHSAGTKTTSGSLDSRYNYNALFGRLNYRIKDRYILNLAARRDGSSRFGSENLFHNFYSIGAAWLFSEEQLFKKILPFIDYGKLRASYGTTGNDQIEDYLFYSLYNTASAGVPYLGVTALAPNRLSNPYLQWEETRKMGAGVDIGFFDSRILFTANYFRNRSSNQLLGQNLSIVTGFGNILRNLPAIVQNTGWEFNLQYTIIKHKDFNWQGSFNITLPKNKLVRYDGLDKSNDRNRYAIGESITLVKAYSFAGVNPETGLYQFRNTKGELTSAPITPEDRTVMLTTDPKWYGGFNNTFSYKGFSLDLFFNFVNQWGSNLKFKDFPTAFPNSNYLVSVLDHWKQPGDIAPIQRVTSDYGKVIGPYNAAKESDGAYDKITYARLNNASLSYIFNNDLTRRIGIENARMYIQGQNLFAITNYKNGDPGLQKAVSIGLLRMITLGTQITF